MAKYSREQLHELRIEAGRKSMAGRARYPKGHPRAGKLLPRGELPPDPTQPPADPPPQPPADPPPTPPADPPAPRLNPLTMSPRDVFDRIRGR